MLKPQTMFVDMNSYFASVEQQLRPELRGKPIAVSPVVKDCGCCISVSVEAKAHGVRTGTRVGEARQLCPDIVVVSSRPRTYVRMHHRILQATRRVIPIETVHSIDEFSIELMRNEVDRALEIAHEIKESIRTHAGSTLRCSIGIAPNKLLAKTATEIEKPDGLVVLRKDELPGRVRELAINDIPGIGRRMSARMRDRGVLTIDDLYELSEREMYRLWGSVMGSRMYHDLHGDRLADITTRTHSISHEHVLEPENRTDAGAQRIMMRLATKAAARARHTGYLANAIDLHIRFTADSNGGWGRSWHSGLKFESACADTVSIVRSVRSLWNRRPVGTPKLVSVALAGLVKTDQAEANLFDAPPGEREQLWQTVDQINARLGNNMVYPGAIHGLHKKSLGGISFHTVPDLEFTDTVGESMGTHENQDQ